MLTLLLKLLKTTDTEITQKIVFDHPGLFITSSPETPANICIKLIMPKTKQPGIHFCF